MSVDIAKLRVAAEVTGLDQLEAAAKFIDKIADKQKFIEGLSKNLEKIGDLSTIAKKDIKSVGDVGSEQIKEIAQGLKDMERAVREKLGKDFAPTKPQLQARRITKKLKEKNINLGKLFGGKEFSQRLSWSGLPPETLGEFGDLVQKMVRLVGEGELDPEKFGMKNIKKLYEGLDKFLGGAGGRGITMLGGLFKKLMSEDIYQKAALQRARDILSRRGLSEDIVQREVELSEIRGERFPSRGPKSREEAKLLTKERLTELYSDLGTRGRKEVAEELLPYLHVGMMVTQEERKMMEAIGYPAVGANKAIRWTSARGKFRNDLMWQLSGKEEERQEQINAHLDFLLEETQEGNQEVMEYVRRIRGMDPMELQYLPLELKTMSTTKPGKQTAYGKFMATRNRAMAEYASLSDVEMRDFIKTIGMRAQSDVIQAKPGLVTKEMLHKSILDKIEMNVEDILKRVYELDENKEGTE